MGSPTMKLSRRKVLGIAAGGVAGAVGFRYLTLSSATPEAGSAAGGAGAWASPLATHAGLAAHLLRRAGFGYSDAELDAAASMSYPDLVDMLLNQQPQPLPAVADPTNHQMVVRAWYEHMATTSAQFPERMTLFWHGLLTSDYRKAARLPLVLQQNELYRSMGRGDFRSLINAVTFDPLMIRYLDLEESAAAAPNENYSRELMELFTLGVNTYTEQDVREGARAFSGIRITLVGADGSRVTAPKLKGSTPAAYAAAIAQLLAQGVTFKGVLNGKQHDSGSKTILGQSGTFGPSQVIDIILAQPSCAPHIARLALTHFCTPNPPTQLIDSVAATFRHSNYDIKTLMRAIFTNAAFTSPDAYRSLVRGPAEYMVTTMRALGRPDLAATCVKAGAGMDQVLYDMPTVAGWPANQGWVSSGGWLARLNFANAVVASGPGFADPVDAVRTQLDNVVGPDTARVFNAGRSAEERSYAVLSSPEFQLK
jgi:uncharacterized protein (DUF1800 family)